MGYFKWALKKKICKNLDLLRSVCLKNIYLKISFNDRTLFESNLKI